MECGGEDVGEEVGEDEGGAGVEGGGGAGGAVGFDGLADLGEDLEGLVMVHGERKVFGGKIRFFWFFCFLEEFFNFLFF